MANRDVHIPAGLLSPFVVFAVYLGLGNPIPLAFSRYLWFFLGFFMGLAGFLGERTPEWLEPPDNPRHRGLFHSVGGTITTVYLLVFFFIAPTLPLIPTNYNRLSGLLVVSYMAGYTSHFIFDYILPS